MIRVGILLITVVFLITAALIAGVAGYVSPSQNLEIRTWYDLDAVRNDLNSNYTLMNDLDSTSPGYEELASPTANGGKGWQPIASFRPWTETTFTGFMGIFDGQGYEIRDLFINRPDELSVGLFGEVGQEGVIKDIGVANATVTGNDWMGLFAVVDEGGRIEDISLSSATVTGEDFVGGLVGVNGGTVSNSYSTASVTGEDFVGGLVGVNGGTVSNSFWDTETSGQATSAGGTGKTTAEMQDIATFTAAGWDIIAVANASTRNSSYIWNIVDGETYPFLSSQPIL